MNLMVGPLTPAVYWWRRAIVSGVLLLLILAFLLGSFAAPDFAEGVNSFLERREPHFAALRG